MNISIPFRQKSQQKRTKTSWHHSPANLNTMRIINITMDEYKTNLNQPGGESRKALLFLGFTIPFITSAI